MKIVYAGLLGVAQNLMGIIENVDFESLGVELHIYGGGNQKKEIENYISMHHCNVFFHGYVEASKLNEVLKLYDVSLIPLATYIKGAVPSKIFDTMPLGLPMLFCGEGEGAEIINQYKLGFVSKPNDYVALANNIQLFSKMKDWDCKQMSERCKQVSKEKFNYGKQMDQCYTFIHQVIQTNI